MNDLPTRTSLFQYSFLALPLAFAGLPLYIHAPDFYTRDLGVSLGVIGALLMFIRLFDAVQDPLIGYFSDKYTNKRFSIIFCGIALLITGMGGVFYGPQFSVPAATWFASSMIFATIGFSIVTINLNMIGGFWHDNPDQRTRISAWREAFALTGLLIAAVLPTALQSSKTSIESFQIVFWIFVFLMTLAAVIFAPFMRRLSCDKATTNIKNQKGFAVLSILIGPDNRFFIVCFLSHLAASFPAAMVLFFIRDYLDAEKFAGLFLLLYFLSGAALMGVWVKLAEKIGKEKTWILSMVLSVLTFGWAFVLQPGDIMAYSIICILSGTALGADLALPPSIIADRITARRTQNEATQYYALLAFISKTMIALASGISFLILDRLGFVAGIKNPEIALEGLIALYALVPCVIKIGAAFCLWHMHKHEGDFYVQKERTGSHGNYGVSH